MRMPGKAITLLIVFFMYLPASTQGSETGGTLSCLVSFWKTMMSGEGFTKKLGIVKDLERTGSPLPAEAQATFLNQGGMSGYVYELGVSPEVAMYINHAGQRSSSMLNGGQPNGQKESDYDFKRPKSRYVSPERLSDILDTGWARLSEIYINDLTTIEKGKDPRTTKFYVYGTTAGTREGGEGHELSGIKFQARPMGPPNTIKFHVNLVAESVPQQAYDHGKIGVAIIAECMKLDSSEYSALPVKKRIDLFMKKIYDSAVKAGHGKIELDGAHFEGPAFDGWTDDLVALATLKAKLTKTIMLTAEGSFSPASQYFYKKVLFLRHLSPDLSDLDSPPHWQKAEDSYMQSTGARREDLVKINWISTEYVNLEGALEIMARMRQLEEPMILSSLGPHHSAAEWAKALHAQAVPLN